jgi:Tfp pilus assembly protein PilF
LALDSFQRARARIRLGSLFLSAQRPALAREQFQRSLELTPLPNAWLGLGHSYLDAKQPNEALEAFQQARAGVPKNLSLHRGEAEAWMLLGEPVQAHEAMQRAAELAPHDSKIGVRLREISQAILDREPGR